MLSTLLVFMSHLLLMACADCWCTGALALQRWTSLMVLIGLLMGLYAGFIYSHAQRSAQSGNTKKAYLYVLRLLGCMLLCSFANVLKTLIAKILSCQFYCTGYFDKMQDALRKVCCPSVAPPVPELPCSLSLPGPE